MNESLSAQVGARDVWLPAKLFLCVVLGGVALAIVLASIVVALPADAALLNQRDAKTYAVRDMDEAARILPCERFSRKDDGSWVSSAVIITPPDNQWERTQFKGATAKILDRRCGDNLEERG